MSEFKNVFPASLDGIRTAEAILDKAHELQKREGVFLETHVDAWNRYLGGMARKVVMVGTTGCLKSSFALNLAIYQACVYKTPVLYYDTENGAYKTLVRLMSSMLKTPVNTLAFATDWQEFSKDEEVEELRSSLRLFYNLERQHLAYSDRTSGFDLGELVKKVQEKHTADKVLVIVDSVQKLPMDVSDRRTGSDWWVRKFESIMRDTGAYLLLISEVSRGNHNRPSIESAKESGDWEYFAEQFFYQLPVCAPGTEYADKIEMYCLKNRHGLKGKICDLRVEGEYARLIEIPGSASAHLQTLTVTGA